MEKLAIESALEMLRQPINFEHLPSETVRRVAVLSSSVDSFAWCASCAQFYQVQPKLRGLLVGAKWSDLSTSVKASLCHLDDEFILELPALHDRNAHKCVSMISSRHGSEVTHLYLFAWETYDAHGSDTLPMEKLARYGRCLTSLRFLYLQHMPRGSTHVQTTARLSKTALQLIGSACSLRSLVIFAQVHLSSEVAFRIVQLFGRKLHHIAIDMTPYGGLHGGDENQTEALRECVSKSCPNLQQPAIILCHYPLRYRDGFSIFPSRDWWAQHRPSEAWVQEAAR